MPCRVHFWLFSLGWQNAADAWPGMQRIVPLLRPDATLTCKTLDDCPPILGKPAVNRISTAKVPFSVEAQLKPCNSTILLRVGPHIMAPIRGGKAKNSDEQFEILTILCFRSR